MSANNPCQCGSHLMIGSVVQRCGQNTKCAIITTRGMKMHSPRATRGTRVAVDVTTVRDAVSILKDHCRKHAEATCVMHPFQDGSRHRTMSSNTMAK
jgi:hypothetical protein